MVLFGIAGSTIGGITHAVSQGLLPTLIRYRGISLSYTTGIGVGGFIAVWYVCLDNIYIFL